MEASDKKSEAKARVNAAREAAWNEVTRRLENQLPPDLIRQLLEHAWQSFLTLIHLRHGPGSDEWLQNVAFIDDFLWSGEAKKTAADVARLQSMLPKLSEQLRMGLEAVAYSLDEIQALFEELKATYKEQLEERYRPHLHIPSVRSAARLKRISHLQPIKIPEVDAEAKEGRREAAEQRVLKEIRALERGAWMEFTNADGDKVRAKLSWRSPMSGKLLFVNAQGTKLADKSEEDLVDEILSGETLILDSQPVFHFEKKDDSGVTG